MLTVRLKYWKIKELGGSFLGLGKLFKDITIVIMTAVAVTGCLNQKNPPSTNTSSGASSTLGGNLGTIIGGAVTNTSETQCLVFQGTTKDYNTCLGCKNTLCSNCQRLGGAACSTAEIAACSLSDTLLVQCVHDNIVASGGVCTGLTCGAGQIADFTSCLCKDATPPTSIGAAPGQEDRLTPYVEPGFYLYTKFCAPGDIPAISPATPPVSAPFACMLAPTYTVNPSSGNSYPKIATQAPQNVFQDTGYLRWDLALDASQFSPALQLGTNLVNSYTSGTIPGNFNMYYQLKPNTSAKSTTIKWQDCVEHFSADPGYVSTNNFCDARSSNLNTANAAPSADVVITGTSTGGTAQLNNISLNGGSINRNYLTGYPLAHPNSSPGFYLQNANTFSVGLNKRSPSLNVGTNYTGTTGTGMLSNLGYYKFTWGPLAVQNNTTLTDVSTVSVSGRLAINTNLGFTPGSMVESTAMSPLASTNSLPTRDCASNTAYSSSPHPCVVTSVYRSRGGAILSQSFSPIYASKYHSSPVSTLPGGIVAVSTPKLIEDISQDTSTSKAPARLRTFVRADDGNIYMSLFKSGQWNSWLSLGRPWTCPVASATCTSLSTATATAPPYRPLDPAVFAVTSNNDGISIASEPVVASYMDTTTPGNVTGVIAVFVRVSQMRSSDGGFGAYHNAIFYTMAKAASPTVNGKYIFDDATQWSKWQPVGNPVLRIQGNPTVIVRSAGGDYIFNVFGTKIDGNPHPPIAVTPAGNDWFGTSVPDPAVTPNYNIFNYGTVLTGTSIGSNIVKTTNAWTANVTLGNGTKVKDTNILIWHRGSFTSDWTFAPLAPGSGVLKDFTSVRLFAVETFVGETNTWGQWNQPSYCFVPLPAAASNWGGPCAYNHQTHWVEVDLGAAGPTVHSCGAGLPAAAEGSYAFLNFLGTPNPINITGFVASGGHTTGVNAGQADPNASFGGAGSAANNKLFIFGRAVCSDKTKCDSANPGVAYAAVNSLSECTNAGAATFNQAATMYYYGGGQDGDNFATLPAFTITTSAHPSFFPTVQAFPVTSDVVPFYSNALNSGQVDLPIYTIGRDVGGNISNGLWGSSQAGALGTPIMQFFSTGGFVN